MEIDHNEIVERVFSALLRRWHRPQECNVNRNLVRTVDIEAGMSA